MLSASGKKQIDSMVKAINKQTNHVWSANDLGGVDVYEDLKKQPVEEQKGFVLELIHYVIVVYGDYNRSEIACHLLNGILRRNLHYDATEWKNLMLAIKHACKKISDSTENYFEVSRFPWNYAIQQIERYLKKNPLDDALSTFIKNDLLVWEELDAEKRSYWGADLKRTTIKLKKVLQDNGEAVPFELKTEDIGTDVMTVIHQIEKNNAAFYKIFELSFEVSGSKPSKKFLTAVKTQLEAAGKDHYRKVAHDILDIAISHQISEKKTEYDYVYPEYLCEPSRNFIKGIVWTLDAFSDKTTISLLEKLLHKSYTKMPGIGPAAASIGNACVYVLGNMRGKDGLGALSRAKLKVKQNNVKKMIDKQLDAGAKKYGVSVAELEEMAVPDFGLVS